MDKQMSEPFFQVGARYRVPGFLAVGWIPAIRLCEPLPDAFRLHKRWWAHRLLFLTGNRTPPTHFRDEADVDVFRLRKEYRSMLGIAGVEVTFDTAGRAMDHAHEGRIKGGYTPIGVEFNGGLLHGSIKYYSSGVERGASSVALGDDFAPFGKSIEFRIGKLGNLVAWLTVRHWAPYAAADFSYIIHADGTYQFEFRSTAIPSQTLYEDLRAVDHYRLEAITPEQLDGFLSAETRQCAPTKELRFSRSGRVETLSRA